MKYTNANSFKAKIKNIAREKQIPAQQVQYSIRSIFSGDRINISSYNLETVLAEKVETVLSRGEGSTRPRDRYDLCMLWDLRKEDVNIGVLKQAILNTGTKRKSVSEINNWAIV
jgi:predicted nucleotidyltransferase component of viral defense system